MILKIVENHMNKYPVFEFCDIVKLVYQNEFAGGHMITDIDMAYKKIFDEYDTLKSFEGPLHIDDIGNGLVRVHLASIPRNKLKKLYDCFAETANNVVGSKKSLVSKLYDVASLFDDSTRGNYIKYVENYVKSGCPVMSHSKAYKEAYHPAYRVIFSSYLSELK